MKPLLVRSAWVMHLLVEDSRGPLESRKPPGAVAFERAAVTCPGSPGATLGHPGKRFRIACGVVQRPTAVHRATVTPEMVNCPGCRKVVARAA